MHATRILSEEHEVILGVLDSLDRLSEAALAGGGLDVDAAGEVVDFLRTYADAFHHGKEEALLFPRMVERGESDEDGPVALMCEEHVVGRGAVGDLGRLIEEASAGVAGATASFVRCAHDFAGMLREHIDKEENVVFPLAESVLDGDDDWALADAYAQFEAAFEVGAVSRCLGIARRLRGQFPATPARPNGAV